MPTANPSAALCATAAAVNNRCRKTNTTPSHGNSNAMNNAVP